MKPRITKINTPIKKNANNIFAIVALPDEILVNPKRPVINAKMAKIIAHFKNIRIPLFNIFLIFTKNIKINQCLIKICGARSSCL